MLSAAKHLRLAGQRCFAALSMTSSGDWHDSKHPTRVFLIPSPCNNIRYAPLERNVFLQSFHVEETLLSTHVHYTSL